MFKDVKNQLKTMINTLVGSSKPLKSFFAYREPSPQSYPCAKLFVSDGSLEQRLDTASNFLTMEFTIRVEMKEKNSEAAEDQRLDLISSIVGLFRSQTYIDTLNGLVERIDIISINPLNANEDQPVFGFDLVLQASKIMLIS